MMLLASAAALTLAPAEAFGQREHFAAMLALPYVAPPRHCRWSAHRVKAFSPRGAFCGAGMAFKPYLLAIPLLVETFLLWERRAWRNLFRAEIFGMGSLLAVFPFLVWQFTPHYFSQILPLMLLTYGAFQITFAETALRPAVAGFVVLGLTASLIWRQACGAAANGFGYSRPLGASFVFSRLEKG